MGDPTSCECGNGTSHGQQSCADCSDRRPEPFAAMAESVTAVAMKVDEPPEFDGELFVEVFSGVGSRPEPAPRSERRRALVAMEQRRRLMILREKIDAALGEIPPCERHVFSHGVPGFAYSSRTCVACGHASFI